TKVNTSPERSQPKQYQDCICGLTLKLGLSSWWKGQRPQKSLLRFVRRTCSWTTLTRSTLALTSAKASSDAGVGTTLLSDAHRCGNGATVKKCGGTEPWSLLARPFFGASRVGSLR